MIAIVFLAIMLSRPALSLRNVAFAALIILAAMPESLLDPSFQMSFAATAALIAGMRVSAAICAMRAGGWRTS